MKKNITATILAKELSAYLDPQSIADRGVNGLHITNEGPITSVATAVTPSLDVIEKAVALKVQALITHHGFSIADPYPINDQILYKKIKLLIQNNIALLRYHLPLDAHQELGNNWKAARDLGWQNLEPFGRYYNTTIGVKGTFAPQPFSQFVAHLEKYYGNKATIVAVKKEVASAALVSGGAEKMISEAAQAQVDCFVTGTFDEINYYVAHEENINFCALGHAATEKVGVKALAEYLQKTYGINTTFIDTKNPF